MKHLLLFIFIIFAFVIFARINLDANKNNISPTSLPKPSLVVGELEITGWFAAWNSEKAADVLPPVIDTLRTFSPMLYRIMADGSLGRHSMSNREEILSYARDKNVPIAPVITDESGAARVQILLNDSQTQNKFIDDLVAEAKEEGFIGWSIDIEKITSKDRDKFSSFVRNLSSELHANNLKLYMIAYGRDADETYDPALAHDYKVFGHYADQVQLMIYYYSNEYTAPGGQTPLKDYRSVLTYALENIPREKILIGLSTYGNDWGGKDDEVEGLTYQQVEQKIKEENPDISYDSNELSMVARYTQGDTDHILMYENAKTITEKMRIAREEFGINKFAFWAIGNEDPELWKEF